MGENEKINEGEAPGVAAQTVEAAGQTAAVDETPAGAVGASAETSRLIAEAEERGYRRGLMEQGERLFRRPGVFEGPAGRAGDEARERVIILNNRRKSVWED